MNTETREQLELIVNKALAVASDMLRKNGEFYPFGIEKHEKVDELSILIIHTQEGKPESAALISQITDNLRNKNKSLEAACICYAVTLKESKMTDAVCVKAEHNSGTALLALQPYSINDSKLVLGEAEFSLDEAIIFG